VANAVNIVKLILKARDSKWIRLDCRVHSLSLASNIESKVIENGSKKSLAVN
jgi:hypothetical protein